MKLYAFLPQLPAASSFIVVANSQSDAKTRITKYIERYALPTGEYDYQAETWGDDDWWTVKEFELGEVLEIGAT